MSGVLTANDYEWVERERNMAETVMQRALDSSSMDVPRKNLVVRGILPARDLVSGEENGWTDDQNGNGEHEWRQDWSSNGTADAYNEAYVIDSDTLAEDKIIGIYGLTLNSTTDDIRQIRVSAGAGGSQGILREMNVEPASADEEVRGLLSDEILFGPKETGQIDFYLTDTTDNQRVILHGWTAEPAGETVKEPSVPHFLEGNEASATRTTTRRRTR